MTPEMKVACWRGSAGGNVRGGRGAVLWADRTRRFFMFFSEHFPRALSFRCGPFCVASSAPGAETAGLDPFHTCGSLPDLELGTEKGLEESLLNPWTKEEPA